MLASDGLDARDGVARPISYSSHYCGTQHILFHDLSILSATPHVHRFCAEPSLDGPPVASAT